MSSGGGIASAVGRAVEIGCDSLQVFTQSSRTWKPTRHDPAELERFRAENAEAGDLPVLCHAIYFINLAAPEDQLHDKSVAALLDTTRIATAIGAQGVVVHVGSHKGLGLAGSLARIEQGLAPALEALGPETWLLLENSAGAGGTIGRDVEELAQVIEAVPHERLGLCLDSCHLYVSGVDVRVPAVVDELLDRIDERVGLDRLRALHINDAAAGLGSNRDRHANIGTGELGDGLAAFVAHPRLQHLPAVIETAGPDGKGADATELRELRRIHALGLPVGR